MKHKMKPNITEIQHLVDNRFGGNKAAFAAVIGVDRGQVSKILKDGTGAGAQFFGGLMAFCDKEHLEFKNYIFLPENVKKINALQPTGTDNTVL